MRYRWIVGMPSPGVFLLDTPFEAGTARPGDLVSVDVVKAQNIHVGNYHVDTGLAGGDSPLSSAHTCRQWCRISPRD